MSKTTGLNIAKSMGVLVMSYMDICFCYLWDLWFLNGPLDPRSLWGSVGDYFWVFGKCGDEERQLDGKRRRR